MVNIDEFEKTDNEIKVITQIYNLKSEFKKLLEFLAWNYPEVYKEWKSKLKWEDTELRR